MVKGSPSEALVVIGDAEGSGEIYRGDDPRCVSCMID